MGQSVLPLRADTVLIEKTGGSGELKIKNNTRDTLGVMVNMGGGRTRFMRVRVLNDSTFIMPPSDTIVIRGGASGGTVPTLNQVTAEGNGSAQALRITDVTLAIEYASLRHNGSKGQLDLEDGVGGVTEYRMDSIVKGGNALRFPTGPGTFALREDLADSAAAIRADFPAGTPGGSTTQIQYNNAGAFAGDAGLTYDAAANKLTTDSVTSIKNNVDTTRSGTILTKNIKNWWFFGTSIPLGGGLSDTTKRWPNIVSTYYSKVEVNRAVSGSTLIKNIPLNPFGGTNMIDWMQTQLLTKTASDEKIFFAFGENDVAINSANYDTTEYKVDYDSVINFALTKGWSIADMVIASNGYIDTTTNSFATRLRQIDFVSATRNFSASRGIQYIEIWPRSFAQNWLWFYRPQAPLTHPGDEGHSLFSQLVIESIGDQIIAGGQRLAVSDTTEVQFIKIRSGDTATASTQPVGVSPNGSVVKYPKGGLILNDPITVQSGRIRLSGDISGNALIANFGMLGTGTSFLSYPGTSWRSWVSGTSPTLYAFDGTAPAWRQGSLHAANFLFQIQTNAAFQLTMSTSGRLESIQNDNSPAYFSVTNTSTGTAASSGIRIGTNISTGIGTRLEFYHSGFTPVGAYTPSTSVLDANATNATGGLNIVAANAGAGIKLFAGGSATGNERVRITSAGLVGIGTTGPAVTLHIGGTDAVGINGGTTAQRPTGAAGYIRWNTDSTRMEIHTGTKWVTLLPGDVPGGLTNPMTTAGDIIVGGASGVPARLAIGANGTFATSNGTTVVYTTSAAAFPVSFYTPTLTGVLNVTSTAATDTYYQQIGDKVEVWGTVQIDPTTATTLTTVGVSLPVASTFTDTHQLSGSGFSEDIQQGFAIKSDAANSRALISFFAADASGSNYQFKFSYKVTPP